MPHLSDDILQQLVETIPYMKAIGASYLGHDAEGVSLKLPYREDLIGDPHTRVIAGGVVTALLDHGCGLAVWDAVGEFKPIATMDLRIDYMRPATPELDLIITASCYKLTRSVGFVRAFAHDGDIHDPVAAAQSAFIISKPSLKSHQKASA
ncbi:PaaI family thioesterase [Asticcacaulis tiandongensis]|uniref:PaaI family thioesterase n=1 Tax=Asticcacaulis tiandongensis TaxID=2565365 RepID=UPI001127FD49|nr:PaaI family thioesterase [Asticcacaulis tiandongensis]